MFCFQKSYVLDFSFPYVFGSAEFLEIVTKKGNGLFSQFSLKSQKQKNFPRNLFICPYERTYTFLQLHFTYDFLSCLQQSNLPGLKSRLPLLDYRNLMDILSIPLSVFDTFAICTYLSVCRTMFKFTKI